MNSKDMRWLWTALITPFKEGDGLTNPVDYEALDRLLQMQIEWWVTGVLLMGTTAENPTLTSEESLEIVTYAVERLKWKTKVMVNAGTYSTAASIENIKKYDQIDGIDTYLVVNPYYNKPTQTGLYKHFTTIAHSTDKPIILYNIQGRTGVNLETETLIDIVNDTENVIGVKEASGDMLQMKQVIERTGDDFIVLSGDDGLTRELISHGGDGVISVASNCIPAVISDFVNKCLENDPQALEIDNHLSEFFDTLFIQTNPLPAKTYLAEAGIISEEFRLPLCKMDDAERKQFLDCVEKYNF